MRGARFPASPGNRRTGAPTRTTHRHPPRGRGGRARSGYDGLVTPSRTVRLAVLGDSIAFGQGASRPEDRPAARLAEGLRRARGVEVETGVLAVPGARSAGLRAQVDRALPWRPDVAVVVIGANDLTHRVPVDAAAGDLAEAVRRLRAGGAEVVVAPAPDLSSVPHVPPALRPLVRAGSQALRARQVAEVRAAGGWVADADAGTSAAFEADRSLFSGDAFHPSSAGYAVIGASLLPVVLAALAEAGAREVGRDGST
jgi:lysophospholipase L1-like esterase